jgi:hypothetical protein
VATLTVPGTTPYNVTHPTFSGDGTLVAAFIQGGSNARAVWRTDTQEVVTSEADLARLRYYLEGDVLYTNRVDLATIDRLDPYTLEPAAKSLVGHSSALIEVVEDDRHRLVATLSVDGSARLWDEATGHQFGRDLAANGEGLQFLDEGRLLSVPAGDHVSLWNLDTSTWPALACPIAGRNHTREEWDDVGPTTIEYRATCDQFPIDP